MTSSLARRAGDALAWKAAQLAGTKGFQLIKTFVLARLLPPDDFGVFAVAALAVFILTSITELGMVPALVHRQEPEAAHFDGAWTAGLLRGAGLSLLLFIAAPAIADLFAQPRAAGLLRALAFKPLIDAAASIGTASLVRDLKYRRLAFVTLPVVAVDAVTSIALASRWGAWALVAGTLAGGCAGVIASYVLAPHRPRFLLDRTHVQPLVAYGRWIFLSGVLSVSGNSLTQLVISRQLGAAELGLYAMASRLALLPYEIAGHMVSEVAFPVYARIQDDRVRVARAFQSILVGVATIVLPLYTFLVAFAPSIVHEVLGPRWSGTEPLIQLLALVGIVGLYGDTCGPLFRGLGVPKWAVAVECAQTMMVVSLVWTLTRRYGAIGAATAWLVAVACAQGINYVLARRLLGNAFGVSWRPLLLVLGASAAGAAAGLGCTRTFGGIVGLAIAAAAAVAVTGVLVRYFDRRFALGIDTVLRQTFPRITSLVTASVAP